MLLLAAAALYRRRAERAPRRVSGGPIKVNLVKK
jgi:hypothetical protein